VLNREEARALIAAIETGSPTGLRDRALIGIMIYNLCARRRDAANESG
jgi:site-specific recombinase XerD